MHFGYLKNSYGGAFADIFQYKEITAHVKLLMGAILEHYPSETNPDWELLLADFILLFKDKSCFKFHLINDEREKFLQRFVKENFPFETENRMPNIPADASIKFHVRQNIPRDLSDPQVIKAHILSAQNITFDEAKN